ncbi:MAG TPA: RNA methyltransferase [Candidatus Dormibacteraeota bacterium]
MRDERAQKRLPAWRGMSVPGQAAVPRADDVITSPDNEVARRLRRLAQRREPGEVLLEGPRVVREAAAAGLALELLALREDVRFEADARRTVVLSDRVFKRVSDTVTPQGVMAIALRPPATCAQALAAARAAGWPLLVLDGVQDPGNVGAIARTAAAAGAPALALLEGSADPYGPKAVRASAGNVFRLLVAPATAPDLEGVELWGAAAEGGEPLAEAPVEKASALVLGGEAHGLRVPVARRVTIPIDGDVESLNVAAAAAVLLFELRRRLA